MDTLKRMSAAVWRFSVDLQEEWTKDRVGGMAAEIAFFAILAMFPAMLVLASALGSVDALLGADAAESIEDWILDQMSDVFGEGNSVESTIEDFFDGAYAGVFTIGALLAVYTASRGFVAVVRALDVAYDHEDRRSWLSTRLVGFGLTLLTVVVAVVLLVVIVVGPLLGSGSELSDDVGGGVVLATLWDWARWPVVLAAMVGWAASIYHIAPNHQSPWRYELPGALIATVWWLVVSLGFSTYLRLASSGANAVFGLLGGALSVLFWFYLMAMGLLVGAEVNSLIALRGGIDLAPPERNVGENSERSD